MSGKSSTNTAKVFEDPQKVFEKIGKELKRLRLEAGFKSQLAFAIEHKLTPSHYGRYEKGINMTIETLIYLVGLHGLTLEGFFKGMK